MSHRILVATYTNSVYTIDFDPEKSSLARVKAIEIGNHPSWVVRHPDDPTLVYTVTEGKNGRILAVKLSGDGSGSVVGSGPSGGDDPCSILAISSSELLAANYSSGIVSVVKISASEPYISATPPTATHLTGSGPNRERQTSSHPHEVYKLNADTALVPDLGGDRVYTFSRNSEGGWTISDSIEYDPGSGPRHVVSYNGVLYTLLELTSSLAAHRDGKHIKTLPTMSNPLPQPNEMLAAEILIPETNATFPTPYIYVSNRNDPSPQGDIISIFTIEEDGSPTLVNEVRSGLKHLRGMVFGGPDNKWLVAGGVFGGGVKVFERLEGGRGLREVAASLDVVESPTGFLWI
ncbi:putative isomerase YbhE [Cylindrobasidium torrendii FP15055 ss-10]|uniref:Putative isomerase YbhE n=1 Tax=Cylindrobasidium torrendii FP15055 ss-10 TaxID=1314674 RepID=A0A0D7AVX2_9AGAR|nr:putative isomerase YbhE [Cylindrobasidium torrendii FP15055 ss-10]